jgi:hypothetical protein
VGDPLAVHITLQLAIQIATLISVNLGFVGLINTINSYRRKMNVQILMKYTERYERILDQFPLELSPPDSIQKFSPLKAQS